MFSMSKNLYVRSGIYWARFKIEGQEYRRSLYVRAEPKKGSEAKARRALEVLKSAIEDEVRHGVAPPVLWQDAVVDWHEVVQANISDKTFRRYLVSLNQCSLWLAGKPITEITPALLRGMMKDRRNKGVTNATINRDKTAISSVLNFAVEEEWIEANPAFMLNSRSNRERREPIVLPSQHSIAAMRNAMPVWMADMMDFADQTGMRQDEIVRLQWSSVNMAYEEATLHKTKRKKIRTIDFSPGAMEILNRQKRSALTDLVFWHGDGQPFKFVSSRFGAVARKVAQANNQFVRFRFHDLRHNFAVRYLREQRGSLYDLQKLLGHRSIKTTEQYLEHLTPAQQRFVQSVGAQKGAQHQRFNQEGEDENE
jgi:integrase/recombinase XerD